MALFRRTPKGKHALGAAVTSIPSGPLRVAAPLAAAVRPAPSPSPSPSPEPPRVAPDEPSVMMSIAELIASGDAWASDLEDFHALHTPSAEPVPQSEPLPVAVAPTAPPVVEPPAFQARPVPIAPVELPLVVPHAPSARSSLETALSDLLPQQDPVAAEVYPPPTAPRVQLGFRDGTSASLDPDSEQALALELLAQSLTRRD